MICPSETVWQKEDWWLRRTTVDTGGKCSESGHLHGLMAHWFSQVEDVRVGGAGGAKPSDKCLQQRPADNFHPFPTLNFNSQSEQPIRWVCLWSVERSRSTWRKPTSGADNLQTRCLTPVRSGVDRQLSLGKATFSPRGGRQVWEGSIYGCDASCTWNQAD